MLAPPPVTLYSRAPSNSTLPFSGVMPTSAFASKGPRPSAPHRVNAAAVRIRNELLSGPVVRVADIGFILQTRQDGAAHRGDVNFALLLIDYAAAGGDHHGEGHAPIPLPVES